MQILRLGRGLTLVAAVALGRPMVVGADEDRDVPHLVGLEGTWKARVDSRVESTLLAIDLTRTLPERKATDERWEGPWALPVTDVLEITGEEGFGAALAAFVKRLDDPAAKHEDFVVERSWIGTGTSDAELFGPAVDRVRGSRVVFAWGRRDGEKGKAFHLDYDFRGGHLGIPLIAVETSDLPDFARDVRLYLRLLTVKAVSADLWRDLRAIPHLEVRYAAVRDVLDASYGRGLGRAPIGVREAFARDLAAAASDSPRNRLQAFRFYQTWDDVPELLVALLGAELGWLVDLVRADDPLADAALGVAAWRSGAFLARAIGVDLVLAAIDRPRGLPYEIPTAIRILEASTPRRIPLERVRTILRALAGTDGRAWSRHTNNGQPVELLLALTRVLPDLVDLFPSLPDPERAAVREWLRSLRPWAPSLEEPIRKARELFGA